MFDVPDYHLMYKRSAGMNDYDGYRPEESVTVVVHVMEQLTGDRFVTAQRRTQAEPRFCRFQVKTSRVLT